MKNKKPILPEKVVERLSEYRQLLSIFQYSESPYITSSGLAKLMNTSQETVRRDLMLLGCKQSSLKYGYSVLEIIRLIDLVLDSNDEPMTVALIGECGSLISSFLADYLGRKLKIEMVFNFGSDENVVLDMDILRYNFLDLKREISQRNVKIAVMNVSADFAEQVAGILAKSGIKAIINFSPKRLFLPPEIYVEEVNLITKLEKAVYFLDKLENE